MRFVPVVLALVAALIGCRTTVTPETVVSRFYETYVQHPVYGVPAGAQLQLLVVPQRARHIPPLQVRWIPGGEQLPRIGVLPPAVIDLGKMVEP